MITSLMQVEAAPQTRLKSKVSTAQTAVAAYQSVNSKLAAFKTAADNLGQLSTWRGIKATSSSTAVTATAVTGTNGAAGTTTFNVKNLATSQISTARVPGTGDIVDADTITITVGPLDGSMEADGTTPKDKTVTIDVSKDKTAAGVASAINAAGLGVKAALVSTGTSDKILQLSGVKTGADNKFDVSGLGTSSTTVELRDVATAGNALLQIGGGDSDPSGAGYDVTSTNNTFTGLMPGVSITVSKVEDNVTVTAAADVTGIADKFQALVDAANATLSEISSQTAYDASTKRGSPLTGDFAVRNMSQTILGAISQGLSYQDPNWVKPDNDPDAKPDMIDFGSLSKMGISLSSTGRLTFDTTKFQNGYAENADAIQAAGIGFADNMENMAIGMTTNVKSVITGRNSEIDRVTEQIENWDIRLAARKLALQRQYADLETSLGKLKNQSTWLAGQLSGL
ncbi:flagellar filament capping protein FliD [Actinoplanes sp. TRM88002]|uniref:Flagellar hook-associated protein 2 n=2 Tax=Paractinoplanes hotanensis TaxID=2906497 RepID=A0ABT0XU05_9ACTN|nr:flagellar filament capping protein FliD [Actinoplanes hotanensis]